MINKVSAIAIGAVALSVVIGSTAVQAQESCASMYNRLMGIYQANPYSPAYTQMLPYYSSRCATGASYQSPQPQPYADPGYSPGYSQYQQPAPYGYGPAPVDPGAPIVGAAVLGGAIAADSEYGRQDDWGNHGGWRRGNPRLRQIVDGEGSCSTAPYTLRVLFELGRDPLGSAV